MDTTKNIELLSYTIPTLITGMIAYYFFDAHLKNEEKRRKYKLLYQNQKQALPLRLQAYERLTLFLERISPPNLLLRISPLNDDKNHYENLLINMIDQEFEHNLTQQIYVSDECWTIILTAKNTIIQNIRKTNMSEKVDSANKLRETILRDLLDGESPCNVALAYLKSEVSSIL